MSFTDFEKEKNLAKNNKNFQAQVKSDAVDVELQVLGDHSYYEQSKGDENRDKDNDNENEDLNQIMVNEAMGENVGFFSLRDEISTPETLIFSYTQFFLHYIANTSTNNFSFRSLRSFDGIIH